MIDYLKSPIGLETIKSFLTFFGVLSTIGGTIYVAYLTRLTPKNSLQLEQLKLINELAKEGAWKIPARFFVVEEAFRLYYQKHIPMDIIILLCSLDNRFYAFSAYKRVAGLTSFKKSSNKIITLSDVGLKWRCASSLTLSLNLLFLTLMTGWMSFEILTSTNAFTQLDVMMVGIGITIIATILMGHLIKMIQKVIGKPEELKNLQRELKDNVETTETRKIDIVFTMIFGFISIVVTVIFLYLVFRTGN